MQGRGLRWRIQQHKDQLGRSNIYKLLTRARKLARALGRADEPNTTGTERGARVGLGQVQKGDQGMETGPFSRDLSHEREG